VDGAGVASAPSGDEPLGEHDPLNGAGLHGDDAASGGAVFGTAASSLMLTSTVAFSFSSKPLDAARFRKPCPADPPGCFGEFALPETLGDNGLEWVLEAFTDAAIPLTTA